MSDNDTETTIAEKALTQIVADWTGLTIDEELFRYKVPTGVENGVGVKLGSEISDNSPSLSKFNAQIFGTFSDHDPARVLLDTLRAKTPAYGIKKTVDGVTVNFKAILKRGSGGTYPVSDRGAVKQSLSYNLIVCFFLEG